MNRCATCLIVSALALVCIVAACDPPKPDKPIAMNGHEDTPKPTVIPGPLLGPPAVTPAPGATMPAQESACMKPSEAADSIRKAARQSTVLHDLVGLDAVAFIHDFNRAHGTRITGDEAVVITSPSFASYAMAVFAKDDCVETMMPFAFSTDDDQE
jgi:hypothetical protein